MAPSQATATGISAVEYRGDLLVLWKGLCETKDAAQVREILEARSRDVFGEEQVDLHQWITPVNHLDALLAQALRDHALLLVEPSAETKVVAKTAASVEDVEAVPGDVWELVGLILQFYCDLLKNATSKTLFACHIGEVMELLAASRDDVAILALEVVQHYTIPPLTKSSPDSSTTTNSGVTISAGSGRLVAIAVKPANGSAPDGLGSTAGTVAMVADSAPLLHFGYQSEMSEDVSYLALTEQDFAADGDSAQAPPTTSPRKKRRRAGSPTPALASTTNPTEAPNHYQSPLKTTAEVFFLAKERAPSILPSALFVLLCHIRGAQFDLQFKASRPGSGSGGVSSTWRMRATLALLNSAGVDTMSVFTSAQSSPEWYGSITQVLKDMVADLSEVGHNHAGRDGISFLSDDSSPPSFETKLLAIECLAALVSRRDSTRMSSVFQDLGVGKSQTFGVLPSLLRYSLAALMGPIPSAAAADTVEQLSSGGDPMDIGMAFLDGTMQGLPPRDTQVERALSLIEALLSLTGSVTSTPTGTASLVDAGLIPSLLAVVSTRNILGRLDCPQTPLLQAQVCFLTAQAVQVLDSTLVTHSQALSAFFDSSGVAALTSRVTEEVKEIEKAGDITPSQRILLFSVVTCLAGVFHQESTNLGGTTLRQPELAGMLIHMLEHMNLYGGQLAALLATLLSDVMNNDPHIVNYMHQSGIAQAFLNMIGSGTEVRLPVVPELIMVVPNVLAALALTADGANAVATHNPFPPLLRVLYHPRYAMPQSRCLLSEVTSIVGTGLDEISRHVDLLKPLVCKALASSVSNVVEFAEALGSREADLDPITADVETERTCLIQYVMNLLQLLEQVLHEEDLCDLFVEHGGLDSLLRLFPASMVNGSQFLAQVTCLSAPAVSTLHHAVIEETLSVTLKSILYRHNLAKVARRLLQNVSQHVDALDSCRQQLAGSNGWSLDILPRDPFYMVADDVDTRSIASYLRQVYLVQWSMNLLATFIKIAVQRSQDSGGGRNAGEHEWKLEITKDDSIKILERLVSFYRESLLEVCRVRTEPDFEAGEKERFRERSRLRYRLRIVCPEGAVVRDGVEIDSCANVGSMELGEVIEAFDRCINSSGIMRYRTDRGWVSEMTRGHGREPISEVIRVSTSDFEVAPLGKRLEMAVASLRTAGLGVLARGQASATELFGALSRLSQSSCRALPVRALSFDPGTIGDHVARVMRLLSSVLTEAMNDQVSSSRDTTTPALRQGSAMYLGCILGMLHSCLFEEKRDRRSVNLPLLLSLVSADPLSHQVKSNRDSFSPSATPLENLGLFSASLFVFRECSADFSRKSIRERLPSQQVSRFVAASFPPVVSLLRRLVSTPLANSPLASVMSRVRTKDLPQLVGDKNLVIAFVGSLTEGYFEPERFVLGVQVVVSSAIRSIWQNPDFGKAPPHLMHPVVSLVGEVIVGLDDLCKKRPVNGRSASNRLNLSDYFRLRRREETEAEDDDEAEEDFQVDDSAVSTLVEMGFDRDRALDAFESTRSNRVEVAMEYALAHAPPSPATIQRRRTEREQRQRQMNAESQPASSEPVTESSGQQPASDSAERQEAEPQQDGSTSQAMDVDEARAETSANEQVVEPCSAMSDSSVSAKEELASWLDAGPSISCFLLSNVGEFFPPPASGRETDGSGEAEAVTVVICSFLLDLCQGYPEQRAAIVSKIIGALKEKTIELSSSPSDGGALSSEANIAALFHATVLITRALPKTRRLLLEHNLLGSVVDGVTAVLNQAGDGPLSPPRLPLWIAPALLLLDIMAQPMVEFTDDELKGHASAELNEQMSEGELWVVRSEHIAQVQNLASLSRDLFSIVSGTTPVPDDGVPFEKIPPYFPLIPLKFFDPLRDACLKLLQPDTSKLAPTPGVAQAAMLLLLRLLRSPKHATVFRGLGTAEIVMRLPKESKFTGNSGLVSLIFRRLLEDAATLCSSMELEMRATVSKLQGQKTTSGGSERRPVSLHTFMQAVIPLMCRDAPSFLKALCLSVLIEKKSSDTVVSLLPVDQRSKRMVALSAALGVDFHESASQRGKHLTFCTGQGQVSQRSKPGSHTKSHRKSKRMANAKSHKKGQKDSSQQENVVALEFSAASHLASLLISSIVSASLQDPFSSDDSFLWIGNLLEILCELVTAVPAFASAVHNYKPHRMKDKTARAALTSQLQHALTGCRSPPKSFVNFVLHFLLPQDRWSLRLDSQIWDRRKGADDDEAAMMKRKRERAYRITKLSHASARFILALVSRPGEGRRRVIADLTFALSGGTLVNGSFQEPSAAVALDVGQRNATIKDQSALLAWGEMCNAIIAPRSNGKTLDGISALNAENIRVSLESGMVHSLLFGLHRVKLAHPMAGSTCSALLMPLECLTRTSVNDVVRKLAEREKARGTTTSNAHNVAEDSDIVHASLEPGRGGIQDEAMSASDDEMDGDTRSGDESDRDRNTSSDDESSSSDEDSESDSSGVHHSIESMEEDDDHSDEESDSAGSEVEDYADVGDGEEWNGDDADEFPAENEPNGVVDELDADFESSERVEQAIEDGWHRIESSAFGGMLVGGNSSGNNRPPSRLDASAAAEALLSSMLQGGHISDEAIQQLEGSLGFRIMGSLSRAGQGENGFAARVLGNPHGSSSTDQVRRNEAIGTVPHIHQRAQPEVGYSLLSGSSRMAETSAMEFVFGGPSVTGCTRYYDIISSSDARPDGEPQHHLTQLDLQLFPGGPAAVSGSGTQHSLHPLLCGIDLPPMSALVSDLPPHEVRVTRLGQVTTRRPGEVASTALSYGGYLFSTSSGGIIRSSRPNAGAPLANSGLTARHLAAPVGWTDDGLPVDSSVEVFTSAFERAVSATAFVPAPNSTSQVERSEAQVDSNAITNESQQNVTSSDASRNDVSMGEQVESNVNDSAESNQLSSDGVASSLAHGLRLSPGSDPGVSSDALEAIPMIQESMPTVNNPISGESAAVENGDALRGEDAGLSVSSEVVGISEIGTSRDENTSSDDPESGTTGETNANGLVCPPDVDPEVFNSLPFEMQQDCVLQYNSTLELAAQLNGSSLDPEFLAALPEEMRREVIEQDRRDRQLRQEAETQADPSNAQEMDNASFVASLSPELREEILVTADEAFLSSLPPDIVAEAQILRERASSQHRRLYDEGSGSRDNGGIADDGVASSSRHHAAQSAGSRSGGASKRKTRAGKIRIDCVRDELIYRPSSIPPVVGKSDVMLLVRLLYVMSPIRPPRLLQKIFHNLLGVRALRSVCSSLFVYLLHDKRELALAAVESLTAAYGVSDGWRRLMDQLFSPSDFPPSSTIGSTPAVSESDLSLGFIPGRRNQGNDTAAAIVASSNAGSSHYALPPAVCLRLVELLHQLCKNSSRFCYHLLVDQTFQIDSSTEGDTSFELLLDLLELPVFSTSASNMEHLLSVLESAVLSLSYIPKSGEDDAELSQKDIEAAKVAGKEWVEVPKVIVSQSRLQNLCSMLRSENIRDSSFTKINSIVRRLCRVESNRGYVLAELATVAGALGDDAVADLRALKVRLDQAAEHTKQGSDLSVESQPNDDTTRSPTPSHRLSSAIALSTSSSELKLLRVLQTLQALCLENWQDSGSKKSEGSIIVTEELVHLLRKLDFTQLWSELSSCLTVVQVLEGIKVLESRDHDNDSDDADESNDVDGREQNSKLRNSAAGLLTRFIPAIEAFFVANASATRRPESYDEPLPGKAEDVPLENLVGGQRLLSFVATNRVLLNALVRNNSGLLEKGFRALVQVPRCRVFLDFDVKQHWFKSQMRRLRLHASRRHGSLRLSVRRKHVFEEAYHQLRLRNADEIRGRLHITFRNEEGVDAGGLSREFFGILAKEIFNRNYALFTSTEDGCTFQPNQNSSINPDHLSYFRFVGRIVGKAVSDGFLLDAHFTRSLYKHMLGMRPTYHDMEAIDPDYYRNLKTILEYNLSDLGLDLNFSIEDHSFGRSQTIDLITNGRSVPVTEENKEEYVRLVCQHRMTTAIQAQIKAYLDGFYELVPPELISIFTPRELELLISGLPDIDVHDLKQNTEYVGWKATDKEIEWFWNVLTSLTRGEKASFLQFATGSSKVPLAGFGELQGMRGVQKFSIHRASGRAGALMSAHTCFNQLDLPRYASEEETREKLLYAINEGGGAFLFA